jgi:hypothetical protein
MSTHNDVKARNDEMESAHVMRLRTMSYPEYLKTREWADKREQALDRDGHRCRVCNSSEHLHVHHRTYERRGNEDLNDLTTLCKTCHESFHERMRQDDLMEMTYTAPVVKRSKEEIEQRWEDFLIGMLIQNSGLLPHIRGILSDTDFAGEDTRVLYQLLNTAQPLSPSLMPAVVRCREVALSEMPTSEIAQIRAVVQAATRIKRARFLQVNNELSLLIREAAQSGDRDSIRGLQLRQLEAAQQLRTLNAAMLLGG